MTDLLAPLLAALDDEAEAFWCFTKLVEGTAFFRPAKNHISVDRQLVRAYSMSLLQRAEHASTFNFYYAESY